VTAAVTAAVTAGAAVALAVPLVDLRAQTERAVAGALGAAPGAQR